MIPTVKRGQFEQWSESQIGLKPGLIYRYMFNISHFVAQIVTCEQSLIKLFEFSETLNGIQVPLKITVYRPQACNFIKKETLTQVFSCEFCEILIAPFLQNTFAHVLLSPRLRCNMIKVTTFTLKIFRTTSFCVQEKRI